MKNQKMSDFFLRQKKTTTLNSHYVSIIFINYTHFLKLKFKNCSGCKSKPEYNAFVCVWPFSVLKEFEYATASLRFSKR